MKNQNIEKSSETNKLSKEDSKLYLNQGFCLYYFFK